MRQPTPSLREPQAGAVRASRTDGLRRLVTVTVLSLVAAVFLTFSGAFGTGGAPWLTRFGYWVVVMVAGGLLGAGVSRIFESRGWLETRPSLQVAAVALVITALFTTVVWLLTAAWYGFPLQVRNLAGLVLPVGVISVVMTALNELVDRRPRETHVSTAVEPPPVRFLERLPLKLRGSDLYAVSAEDHYLRLHTSRGSDLILMRLSDAIGELEGIEGAQTHRSWWVAKDAVTKTSRGEGRGTLTLKDGTEAPVSRTYAKALRDEGWFA